MAIFGEISDLPLSDVLGVVRPRRGVLTIRQGIQAFDLEVGEGLLLNFVHNGARVDDVLSLTERFGQMLQLRTGCFLFRPGATLSAPHLRVPLGQLVASTQRSLQEREASSTELPSAHTVFLATEPTDLHLPEDLQIFWERAVAPLRAGATALQLSGCTGVSVQQARWLLSRLRSISWIRPRRPHEREGWHPLVASAEQPAASAGRMDSVDLTQVKPKSPQPTLLQRLTDGLRQLFRHPGGSAGVT